ncbi:hypothetical protein PVL30_003453 [Lodderomyces elongisporus]|uniref:Uncharacterized protein n=1 Tax=Lodderomyces elongisporus (strain ATCC 11503 / CBS 2605 / JCM 1781 / NBRC 1676 / NRRL YB-4239) TaxID=379508 RepID=A5DZ25_LODEL|nr:uncharacterized protein PVL30_003453 [Lodderomyces elongisporus]EDK44433.1 conserved hypothetical protein [Lodderomyces elongisporus NRRL YB-4239]WLF79696.1 hypothetical protein PVL30_003453 [Lodderomyces elongisporus]
MGYPTNLKITTKSLTENILLASTAFTRFDRINFGARMAILKFPATTTPVANANANAGATAGADTNVGVGVGVAGDKSSRERVVIWSPLPYSPQVLEVIQKFTGAKTEADIRIDYVIVPDREHNMAASVFKEKFPQAKIIGPEKTEKVDLDVVFTESLGNKVIAGEDLRKLIDDDVIVDNFEFVYLPYHANSELVAVEKKSKVLFEADLLFNLGAKNEQQEQFSPATGYPENYNPHTGWSYPTRYLHPYSKVGKYMFNKIVNKAQSKAGLEAIGALDFNAIVLCHGNIITKNAKEAFKHVFLS